MSVAIATAFVACMVGFQIDDKVYARLESLSEIDLESELREGRAYIWSIAWKAMTFYGWLGSGLGTFHFAYLPFQEPSSQGWYYHAESLYAQCGVELGFIGVSALLLAVILLIMGLQRPVANENWGIAFPSKLAGVYLVISQSLHSFVDFAIILPALFVPAAVLIGSVLGALRKAEIAPVRKRSRSDASNPVPRVVRKDVPWLWKGFVGVLIAAGCGLAIADSTKSLESLSISESMDAWTKSEEAKPQELQSPNRVQEMAKIWASHNASLKENSTAMRAFADSLIFDYRMNQLVNSTASSAKTWTETSPVFLQLVLNQELNQLKKEQMIDSVGGQQAVSLLERSSKWYALGQAKSPLDGRLLWGRCFSNTICDRNEIAKLLPASITIAKQNSQQLLATTILFRDLFDETQMERVLEQAMKSDPASSLNAAKVIAAERDDNEVPIKIFPQRFEILQMLATEKDTFTKDRFPQTYRLLWDRARELIAHAPVTNARREIWLADSSIAIGNLSEEIAHLTKAVTYESSNAKLHFRLANRLIDAGDLQGVKKIVEKLKHFDSSSVELKAIEERIAKIDRFQSIPAPHE